MKIGAATAAKKLVERNPLFQVDVNHVLHCGICFEMDVGCHHSATATSLRLRIDGGW